MQHDESRTNGSREPDDGNRWRRIVIAALFAVGICAVTAALVIAHADRPVHSVATAARLL
jgi:hypothetical protein